MKIPTEEVLVRPIGYKTRMYRCGHRGLKNYALDIFGEIKYRKPAWTKCGACMAERFRRYSVRCVVCGFHISLGQKIVAVPFDSLRAVGAIIWEPTAEIAIDGLHFFAGCTRPDCNRMNKPVIGTLMEEDIHFSISMTEIRSSIRRELEVQKPFFFSEPLE